MVNFSQAYTAPINRPGDTPVLTMAHVWQGLQRKIRHAEEFVPVIEACTVLDESADGLDVRRECHFKPGVQADPTKTLVQERVLSYPPAKINFLQGDGSVIQNLVSRGPGGEDDLQMTYMFEWILPQLQEADTEAEMAKRLALAKQAVESSIATIRTMVRDGRIQ